jgi:hypothetical protein
MYVVVGDAGECTLEQLLAKRLHLSGERCVEIELADELYEASIQRATLDETLANGLPVLLPRSQANRAPSSSFEDFLNLTVCQLTSGKRVKTFDQHVAVSIIGRQRPRLALEESQHLARTQAACIVEPIRAHWTCRQQFTMNLYLITRDRHNIETEGMAGSKVTPRDHGKRACIEGVSCPGHLCESVTVTKRDIREPVSDLLDRKIDNRSPRLEENITVSDPMCNEYIAGCGIDILRHWPEAM